jgi:outer membrane protein
VPRYDRRSLIEIRFFLMRFLTIVLAVVSSGQASAQAPIDRYVSEGLAANPALLTAAEQGAASSARATEAARGYLPSLELQARYSRSAGGRTVEFPLGDLLNPAYEALNQVSGSDAFPMVQNQSFRFLRKREQDSRIQLVQPLFEPSISPNARISRALAQADAVGVSVLRRDLSAKIRLAYLAYLEAGQSLVIRNAAVDLVTEAARVSDRLLANGMATGDAVHRAQAELAFVEQDRAAAATTRELAGAVFNTLIARPVDAAIVSMTIGELEQSIGAGRRLDTESELAALALSNRGELKLLDASLRAASAQIALARSANRPSIGLALDLGIQGGAYNVKGDESFRTASIVVRWKLFDGLRRSSRVEQARIAHRATTALLEDRKNQIALEVRQAVWLGNLEARNIQVARRQLSSAQDAYRLTARRYDQGLATTLDLLDARTARTEAAIGLVRTRFGALKRMVELERVTEMER